MDEKAFEEYKEGIHRWNKRQDARLEECEHQISDLQKVAVSIERLAVNMENMLKEQLNQGQRLEVLEKRDGEMWRKVLTYAITAFLGTLIGMLFRV